MHRIVTARSIFSAVFRSKPRPHSAAFSTSLLFDETQIQVLVIQCFFENLVKCLTFSSGFSWNWCYFQSGLALLLRRGKLDSWCKLLYDQLLKRNKLVFRGNNFFWGRGGICVSCVGETILVDTFLRTECGWLWPWHLLFFREWMPEVYIWFANCSSGLKMFRSLTPKTPSCIKLFVLATNYLFWFSTEESLSYVWSNAKKFSFNVTFLMVRPTGNQTRHYSFGFAKWVENLEKFSKSCFLFQNILNNVCID